MKSTAIENELFPLSSLVFRTFDKDDGGSNENVKHMHHTFWCLSLLSMERLPQEALI